MATNIITAAFFGGSKTAKTAALYQWDYGQVLNITGLDTLPDAFEAHFTNTLGGGWAKTQIGTTADGVGTVTIPDAYLESGQPVYCYIYLHNGETDGETEYMITIPVKARAVPLGEAVTHEEQGVIQQYMAALNAGVSAASGYASQAAESALDAQEAVSAAEGYASEAGAQAASAFSAAELASGYASAAGSQAAVAASYATAAASQASAAGAQASAAFGYAQSAQGYMQSASGYASEAFGHAQSASAYASEAASHAAAASGYASEAFSHAQSASAAVSAAQAAQAGAESAFSSAVSMASLAQAAASSAASYASEAFSYAQQASAVLSQKADGITYDSATGELDLMAGAVLLSSVTIESGGGSYTLSYDSTTGRLGLLEDGSEVSYVVIQGVGSVWVNAVDNILFVYNVPSIIHIAQVGSELTLA